MLHTCDQNVYAIWQIIYLELIFLLFFKHFLCQWIFPIQFWNLYFVSCLHCKQILYHCATGEASLTVLKIVNHYAEHQASLKNLPTMQETWVRSLSLEDPLEGHVNHSSILAWRIPMDRGAWQATVHGITKSQTWLSDFQMLYTWNLKLQISSKSVKKKKKKRTTRLTKQNPVLLNAALFWRVSRIGSFPNLYVPGGDAKGWAVRPMTWRFVQIWNKLSLCENLMMIRYTSKSALYITHCFCLWAVNSAYYKKKKSESQYKLMPEVYW